MTFNPFSVPTGSGSTITFGNITLTETGAAPSLSGFNNIFGSASSPFSTLPASYQAILSSDVNTAAATPTSTLTVGFSNLTAGHAYLIQFWVNDSRGNSVSNQRQETILGGGPTLDFNNAGGNGAGGVGQFAVGSFTATGSSFSFSILGNAFTTISQMNALQIRDITPVPEPSSLMMLAAPFAALGAARLRRRMPKPNEELAAGSAT